MAGPRGMRVWFVSLVLALTPARSEVFKFDSELVPDARTMVAKYMFYVYAHSDSPDKSKGHPYVQFADFELEHVDHGDDGSRKIQPGSIQVSLVPWSGFWSLVDQNHFCSDNMDVLSGKAKGVQQLVFAGQQNATKDENNTQDVHIYTVSDADDEPTAAPAKKNAGRRALKHTGVYVLLISNCGSNNGTTVSGKVVVRNAYGFLPANDYRKGTVYLATAILYLIMGIYWMSMCMRHSEDIFYIHHLIGGVLAVGIVEVTVWYIHLELLNSDGSGIQFVLNIAMILSGTKTAGTLLMVLVAALGKGISMPELDGKVAMRLWGLGSVCMVLEFTRMYVMELRHRFCLTNKFIFLTGVPSMIFCAVAIIWTFMGMSGLKKALREQGQAIKLVTYERLTCLLVFMVLLAIATVSLQLYDLPGRGSEWWPYHWISTAAVPGAGSVLFHVCMMAIWAPEEGGKIKATSQQVGFADNDQDDLKEDQTPTGFGNMEEPESGGIQSWLGVEASASTKVEVAETAPSPDTIGAATTDEA